MATFADFMTACRANKRRHPEWRGGQAAFNTLREIRPELAEELRGTEFDPFYRDELVGAFFGQVAARWEENG